MEIDNLLDDFKDATTRSENMADLPKYTETISASGISQTQSVAGHSAETSHVWTRIRPMIISHHDVGKPLRRELISVASSSSLAIGKLPGRSLSDTTQTHGVSIQETLSLDFKTSRLARLCPVHEIQEPGLIIRHPDLVCHSSSSQISTPKNDSHRHLTHRGEKSSWLTQRHSSALVGQTTDETSSR